MRPKPVRRERPIIAAISSEALPTESVVDICKGRARALGVLIVKGARLFWHELEVGATAGRSGMFDIIAVMKNHRVIVVGSSNTDLVLNCKTLPRAGETVLGGAFERFAGGKGANQAVAAARAAAQVAFIGAHGGDDFGRQAKRGLKAEGIDVRHFRIKPEYSSGVALILIGGKEKENLIGVAKSANDALAPEDVRAARVLFARAAVVIAQLEVPLAAVQAAAELAQEHGTLFLMNPAPARKLPAMLLKHVGVLTPNQHEAALLTGETDPSRAARVLRSRGVAKIAVTLGARGVLLCDAGGERLIKAPHVRPVDTVGAGDCFSGYLAAGLAQGRDFNDAAKSAVVAASLAVTRKGAQAGMPRHDEVDKEINAAGQTV
jgi:ribokinase